MPYAILGLPHHVHETRRTAKDRGTLHCLFFHHDRLFCPALLQQVHVRFALEIVQIGNGLLADLARQLRT
jgi:hypothetical protein